MDIARTSMGYVDEATAERLTSGEPTEGAAGLPHGSGYGALIPRHFEHRESVRAPVERALTFRKMRRTSGAVRRCGEALRTLFGEVTPVIDASDDTDDAARELLEEQWGLGPWAGSGRCQKSLRDIVKMCAQAVEDGAFFLAPKWARLDARWWIVDLEVRHLDTIVELYIDSSGRLVGFRQQVDGEPAVVGIKDVLYVCYLPEIGGPLGFGLLRTALGHWEDEQQGFRHQRVAKRRYAHPNPTASVRDSWADYVRDQLEGDGSDWLKKEQEALGTTLSNYAAGSRDWLVPPPWWEIDFLDAKLDLTVMDAAISADERRIYEVYGLGWIHQGRAGSGGARSMVSEQKDHWRAWGRQAVALPFDCLNAQLNAQLYQYNLPAVPRRAQAALGFKGLEPKRSLEDAQRLKIFHEMGEYTPSADDERATREAENRPPMHPDAEALTPFDRRRVQPRQTEAGQRRQRQRRDVLANRKAAPADTEESES